jgi:centromeric protein E
MNDYSSRSHTIFRIIIESRERDATPSANVPSKSKKVRPSLDGAVKVAFLNLVDLAGSERIAHTGAEGVRLREGAHINKSLLTLSTVINKLSQGER